MTSRSGRTVAVVALALLSAGCTETPHSIFTLLFTLGTLIVLAVLVWSWRSSRFLEASLPLLRKLEWLGVEGPAPRAPVEAAPVSPSVPAPAPDPRSVPTTEIVTALVALLAIAFVVVPALLGPDPEPVLLGSLRHDLPSSLWNDAWVDRWTRGEGSLLHSELVLWPVGSDVVVQAGNLLVPLLSVPFQRLFGYPGFWNPFVVFLLLSNGLSAAWLARRAGASATGSFVAGVGFAVAPPLLAAVSTGNQAELAAFPLPLALGATLTALQSGRARDGWLAGGALALACLASWFYGALALVLALGLAGSQWLAGAPNARRQLERQGSRISRGWLPCLLGAGPLIAAAVRGDVAGLTTGMLPHEWAELRPAGSVASLPYETLTHQLMLNDVVDNSISVPELLMGPAGATWGWVLSVAVGLVLAASILLRLPLARFWTGVVLTSATLALGPYLVPPGPVDGPWRSLPFGWLQVYLPGWSMVHNPGLLLVVTALAACIAAACLLGPLTARLPARLRGLPVAAFAGVALATPLLRGATSLQTSLFDPPAWIDLLADSGGAIVEVPIGWSEASAIYQPLHWHPLAGGPGEIRAALGWGPFRQVLEEDPELSSFWRPDHIYPDPESGVDIPERTVQRLGYAVVHRNTARAIASQVGGKKGRELLRLMARIDATLGPPIYKDADLSIYRVGRDH